MLPIKRSSTLALMLIFGSLVWAEEGPLPIPVIAERVEKATVTIRCETEEGLGSGSGFLVDPSGVIVTNFHVVRGCDRAQVKLSSGDAFEVTGVYALDAQKDLAIVRVPGFRLPIVELGDSDSVRKGDRLIVMGNPLGVLEGSVTEGILSGVRELEGLRVFQMDAAVSHGNSGGPVVNSEGQVVGVTSFKLTGGESLNFAIPINYARGLLSFDQRLGIESLSGEAERDLFSDGQEDEGTLTRRWHSMATNTIKVLEQDGEYVTGYGVFPEDAVASVTYDFRQEDDGLYRGVFRWSMRCNYLSSLEQWRFTTCSGENQAWFRLVTSDRLEGEAEENAVPKSQSKAEIRKFCKSLCNASASKTMKGFVWVRKD